MRVIGVFLCVFLVSCAMVNCTEPEIQIMKNDETFEKLLFFEIRTEPKASVIGIDPDTYEIKVWITGGSERYLTRPAVSSDGRLFVNPGLARRGIADDKVVVLNKYGKPIKTFVPMKGVDMAKMFIVNDSLFIGDPGGGGVHDGYEKLSYLFL